MPRNRYIKYGFFTDEQLTEACRDARLLYVGLLTLADKRGRLKYRPKRTKVQIFPYDDDISGAVVEQLLNELERLGALTIYKAEGESFIWIRDFEKHQYTHHSEPESILPAPPGQPDYRNSKSGAVYVLKSHDGYYKIGRSNHVDKRVAQLEIQLPRPVEHIHTIPSPDPKWAESYLHARFADVRTNGEWFRLEPSHVQWLLSLAELTPGAGAVHAKE